jgi:hypothetical protein
VEITELCRASADVRTEKPRKRQRQKAEPKYIKQQAKMDILLKSQRLLKKERSSSLGVRVSRVIVVVN